MDTRGLQDVFFSRGVTQLSTVIQAATVQIAITCPET